MRAIVIGAGVVGLCCAVELQERGVAVELFDRAPSLGVGACSWLAGGMLAPGCEQESADPQVGAWGVEAADWWERHGAEVSRRGSLVLAPPRDRADLERFAARSRGWTALDGAGIGALEPELAGRHATALHFPQEAHIDPRQALAALVDALRTEIRWGVALDPHDAQSADVVLDCRGYAAAADLPTLRGVRGEMLVLRQPEIGLSRPIRLLHPRFPVYVVPRGNGTFMIGATMVESDARIGVTARSAMELLSAVWTLHPAFGEAEILEMGAQVRPAFPDNLPAWTRDGRIWRVNGLYRHGFLLSPAVARRVVAEVLAKELTCA